MLYEIDGRRPDLQGHNFVADNATLIGTVVLEPGASVWFNAVLRADNDLVRIGADSNVQDGAVLHTDPGLPLTVGRGCTIGHQAMLHGCEIGDHTLVGIGAVILNRARIGRDCIVGANSLVTEGKSFPDGVMIMGSPARVVRELGPEEIGRLRATAQVYVEHSERYRRTLRPV